MAITAKDKATSGTPVKKRSSRRGRRRKKSAGNRQSETPATPESSEATETAPPPQTKEGSDSQGATTEPTTPKRSRGRGRGRGRGRKPAISDLVAATEPPPAAATAPETKSAPPTPAASQDPKDAKPDKKKPATRRRRKRAPRRSSDQGGQPSAGKPTGEETTQATEAEETTGTTEATEATEATDTSKPEMIINVSGDAECRIAILENGRLEELYIERKSAESHVGNIYKGRVTNVEPSIQAVFVDFGNPRNGFLHISDVHPQYFPNGEDASETVGKKIPRRDRPPIQRCFRRGTEVVVQVIKEGVGTKGPTLTTYLSIPGRFLVMMPGMRRLGVSRKIEDLEERRIMREALNELPLPEGMGFILRTAGLGRNKRDLQRDLNYLSRLWKTISQHLRKVRAPAEVYRESDLVIRTIRDVTTSDLARIVVDDQATAEQAQEFLRIALPRTHKLVEVYTDAEPIFHKFGIEEEIERINSRHVPLPLGGSLVIESTEAMVTIDVNSGKFRTIDDAEESAFQINLQAADEIARQLRLRDLGGLIVCDFIDMRLERNKREVERRLRNALKKHKERARILRMSQFGLIEMTRQRQRPSIKRSIYAECPHCRGSGMIKSSETMALEVMRVLQLAANQKGVRRIFADVAPQIAAQVLNEKRARLHELENQTDTTITIRADARLGVDQIECRCEDAHERSLPASH